MTICVGKVELQKQDIAPSKDNPFYQAIYSWTSENLNIRIQANPWKVWTGYIAAPKQNMLIKSNEHKTVEAVAQELTAHVTVLYDTLGKLI